MHTVRGVARSNYVGWTDMASAEREPITGVWRRTDPPSYPSPCKNSSDLYQFQERPLAKVGWTNPPRGDATAHTGLRGLNFALGTRGLPCSLAVGYPSLYIATFCRAN